MRNETITIQQAVGLHARPAALFVQTAQKYAAEINISYNGRTANAKSILGILSLGVNTLAEINISADGDDEADAIGALVKLINSNFGE